MRYRPGGLPRERYESEVIAKAVIDGDRIAIDTSSPGRPVLIKVAFHPGWRADDGSPIEMAAPGMLLVTPRGSHVELRWSSGAAGSLGLALTIAAVVALALLPLIPIAAYEVDPGKGIAWCAVVLAVLAGGMGLAVWRHPPVDYGDLLAAGQRAAGARDFAAADRAYLRVLAATDPHHALRDDAWLSYALSAESAGNTVEFVARLVRFLDEFPVSPLRSEVLVRLANAYGSSRPADSRRALVEAADAPLGDAGWKAEARRLLAEAGPQ